MEKKRPQKFERNKLRKILETEDEFISTLFDCFEVPESKEGNKFYTQNNFFQTIILFILHSFMKFIL